MADFFKEDQQLKEQQLKEQQHTKVQAEQNQQQNIQQPEMQKAEQVMQPVQRTALSDKFAEVQKRDVALGLLNEKEQVKAVTTIKKKGIFGKKVEETKSYYNAGELEETKRKERAINLKEGLKKDRNEIARFRMDCSMEAKVACGYANTRLLSRFGDLCTEDLMKKYGKSEDSDGRDEAMDSLTSRILEIKMSDLGKLSDENIAGSSEKFERMSREVDAYRTLLKSNPKYVKKLKEQKTGDVSQYDILRQHLDQLQAVSDYYRVRKMIITDDEFINSKSDISVNIEDSDSPSTARLKEMLAFSYRLARRISSKSGGGINIASTAFKVDSEKSKEVDASLDDLFKPKTKTGENDEDSGDFRDNNEMLEDNIRQRIDQLEIRNYSVNNMTGRQGLSMKQKPNEVITKSVSAYAFGHALSIGFGMADYAEEEVKNFSQEEKKYKEKHFSPHEENSEDGKEKVMNTDYSYSARFKGGKYQELETIDPMDNISRSLSKFPYYMDIAGMTESETLEWFADLSVAETKEYKDNMDDPEAMAYMEEVYSHAFMKSLHIHNALLEKMAESLGQDIFLMHPEDIATRLTEEQMTLLSEAATISNIISSDNREKLKSFVKSYLKDHPDEPDFDVDKFIKTGNAYSSVQFKLQFAKSTDAYLKDMHEEYQQYLEDEDKTEEEVSYEDYRRDNFKNIADVDLSVYENLLGDTLNMDEINAYWDENFPKEEAKYGSATGNTRNEAMRISYYVYKHPELITADKIRLYSEALIPGMTSAQSYDLASDIIALAGEGLLVPKTVAELKAYEKDMKSRKMPATNIHSIPDILGGGFKLVEHDPYQLKAHYKMIMEYAEGKRRREEPLSEKDLSEEALAKIEFERIDRLDKEYKERADAKKKAAMERENKNA